MNKEANQREWPGYLIGTALIATLLSIFFGPSGILYAIGFLAFFLLSEFIANLFRPR
jgi:hypothetical protein